MLKTICYFLCICLVIVNPLSALEPLEKTYVIKLNDDEFEAFIQKAEKPVIVDFCAPWCNPCVRMKPVFEQLANELKEHYLFVSIDIDESKQTAKKYAITTIPAFKIIKDDTVIGSFMGYIDKDNFIEHIDNTIHKKMTKKTLLAAIQADDKEQVAACLKNKEIDVNEIVQIDVMGETVPMTPLMMASSKAIFGDSSFEIISMLLKAGAVIDLEVNSPEFDESMKTIGWNKITTRMIAEETAKGRSEKELMAISNDMIRQRVLECKAKASSLLELFKKFDSEKNDLTR